MKVKRSELERVGKALASFGAFLQEHAEDIAVRANMDSDDGVSGVGYGGSRSGSGHSDPVAARVSRLRWDPVHHAEDRFVSLLRDMEKEAAEGKRRAQSFRAISEKEAKALLKGGDIGGADGESDRYLFACANIACRADVAGTANDRLREGRCEPCYRWRKAHGGNERPRELCHPEEQAEAS